MTAQSGLRFLEDRWDDAVAAKLDAAGVAEVPVEFAGFGPADYELWRGEYELEAGAGGSAGWKDEADSLGEGERGRPGEHQAVGVCDAISG